MDPKRAVMCGALCAAAAWLAGCSALDDSLRTAECASQRDCNVLNRLDPTSCTPWVCVSSSRRCERVGIVDEDGDMQAPSRCGGMDCDDRDANIRVGGLELCDGIDTDCNGLFDGPGEDDDGDGYFSACAGSASVDCDDESASTHPMALELCDGVDNDCVDTQGRSRVSGGQAPAPQEDADGDGHAPTDASCEGGFERDDCDDLESTVFAGAPELCDGLDNDCDGSIDERAGQVGQVCVPELLAAGGYHACALRGGRASC